jgi:ATP-dependent DNA helicase RecQ
VLISYCASNHLTSLIHLKPTTKSTKQTSEKSTKIDTKKITFDLLNKGKSIDEIVSERNLTKSTIEGHLAYYIELGKLEVSSLVEPEKIALIAHAMNDYKLADGISAIKNKLDDSISYGEIRMVIASKKSAENGDI